MFAIQSDVARSVAEALRVTLSSASAQQIAKKGTDNLEAYDLYLQGLYQQNKLTPEGLEKSVIHLDQSIALAPTFARAHWAKGLSYELLGVWAVQVPREALPKAKAAVRRALELDDSIAEAHSTMGDLFVGELDWQSAEASYRRALSLAPNSPFVLEGYAIAYPTPWGRHDESIANFRRAIELDPHSLLYRQDFAGALFCARRYDEAIEEAKRVLAREPTATEALGILASTYERKGAYDAAIDAYQKRAKLTGQDLQTLGGLGWVYTRAGKRDEALKVLATMKERAKKEVFDPLGFAWIYIGLDDKDAAMQWLQRAYDERPNVYLAFLKVAPIYNSLRSDPRFIALLKKVGFEK